jgi:hypothetical protein
VELLGAVRPARTHALQVAAAGAARAVRADEQLRATPPVGAAPGGPGPSPTS